MKNATPPVPWSRWPFRWRNQEALLGYIALDLIAQGWGEADARRLAAELVQIDWNRMFRTTAQATEAMDLSGVTVGDYRDADRLTPPWEPMSPKGRVAARAYWHGELAYVARLRAEHPPGHDGPREWDPAEEDPVLA